MKTFKQLLLLLLASQIKTGYPSKRLTLDQSYVSMSTGDYTYCHTYEHDVKFYIRMDDFLKENGEAAGMDQFGNYYISSFGMFEFMIEGGAFAYEQNGKYFTNGSSYLRFPPETDKSKKVIEITLYLKGRAVSGPGEGTRIQGMIFGNGLYIRTQLFVPTMLEQLNLRSYSFDKPAGQNGCMSIRV